MSIDTNSNARRHGLLTHMSLWRRIETALAGAHPHDAAGIGRSAASLVLQADGIVPLYDSYSKTKRANWMIFRDLQNGFS